MMVRRVLALVLTLAFAAAGQAGRPLPQREALELFGRTVELMEAASVVSPELARAGAPVIENVRQALVTMRSLSAQHTGLTNTILTNVRVFSILADATPKPDP